MKYEIEKWNVGAEDDYAVRFCRELSRKKIEVENSVFLQLGGASTTGGLVAEVRREQSPGQHMGRTVFIDGQGAALATVTVKRRDDGSHVDIIAEPALACLSEQGAPKETK